MNRSTFLIQKITVITLLFSLIMLISCSKEDKCPYDRHFHSGECFFYETNTAKLSINNTQIDDHVMPRAVLKKSKGVIHFFIYSMYEHSESKRWETLIHLDMKEVPFEKGKHMGLELHNDRPDTISQPFILVYMNVDAITAFYNIDEDWQDSHIELLEIDEDNQTVKGRFDIKYLKREQYDFSWPAQEVHAKGEFFTKYIIHD